MSGPAPTQREYWNSTVGDEWAAHAESMDRTLLPVTEQAIAMLALQPGERVLDIGCGAGATALRAARQVGASGKIVGVDISRQLLALARQRATASGAGIDFIEADAGFGEIPGAPFDAAFSRFGIMFFDEPAAAFANIHRAMRPGGRFVFVSWRPFAENLWMHAPLNALAPMLKTPPPAPDPNAPGPFALSDAGKIQSILDASGWRESAITPWDGSLLVGGGADANAAADFLLKIGPCARAVADQQLDVSAAKQRLAEFLAPYEGPEGVALGGACWIVRATA